MAGKSATIPWMRGRGRPSKLSPARADQLVHLVASGATCAQAARTVGLAPRTVVGWRRRAWSREPRDAPYIELERRLVAAEALAEHRPAVLNWEQAAAALEVAYPERWGSQDRAVS